MLGSAGPAFAHGRHDLGELGVESVKLLSFGSARDEGAPVTGYAAAPYPLNRARRGDVRQRVTGHEDQVRALPGGDTSSVGQAEHPCRFSRGSGQGLRRADAAPDKEFELSVQACSEYGPRVRGIRARQQSDPRTGQSPHVVLGPGVGRHLPAMPSRGIRSQPAYPGVAGPPGAAGPQGPAGTSSGGGSSSLLSAFIPGPLTQAYTVASFVPDTPIRVTHIAATLKTAPDGSCSPTVLRVTDGRTGYAWSLSRFVSTIPQFAGKEVVIDGISRFVLRDGAGCGLS